MAPGRRHMVTGRRDRGPAEKHRRNERSSRLDPAASGLVAKPAAPKTKYRSYFEFVQNKDKKKKKLEYTITTNTVPPPGYEYVPVGDPELTSACKELSREKDAMIFMVSNAKGPVDENNLAHHVHRIGHHIRHYIAEEARASLSRNSALVPATTDSLPEPIPESEREYHKQVDAALRDLFPRIPHPDRRAIIEHAFSRVRPLPYLDNHPKHLDTKDSSKSKSYRNGVERVGRVGHSADMPLARRVQLAVLAHIRHNHTRYDDLLKETDWNTARKTIEPLCLDILVKWRGDEETGRDQLEEILRETVVISDTESEPDYYETDTNMDDNDEYIDHGHPSYAEPPRPLQPLPPRLPTPTASSVDVSGGPVLGSYSAVASRASDRRGFRRYQAWNEAIQQSQEDQNRPRQDIGPSDFQDYRQLTHPSSTSRPFGNDVSPQRMSSSQATIIDLTQENHVHERAVRQPVSSVVNGFQDLLVRSIEPASPDAPQSYFIRTLSPRNVEPAARPPLDAGPHHPARTIPPLLPRDFVPARTGIEVRPPQEPGSDHSLGFNHGRVPIQGRQEGPPGGPQGVQSSAYHHPAATLRLADHMPPPPLAYGQHHPPGFQARPQELMSAPMPRSRTDHPLPASSAALDDMLRKSTSYIQARDTNGLIPYVPPPGGRRVVSDQVTGGTGAIRAHPLPPVYPAGLPRNEYRIHPRDHISRPFVPAPTQRLDPMDTLLSSRNVVDAPRPGERPNPVMVDRGGFLQRVDVPPTTAPNPPLPSSSRTRQSSWHEDWYFRPAPAGGGYGFRQNG